MTAATQAWTHQLSIMQQSVLMSAIRGPDWTEKYSPMKMLLRWYRRCILISAMGRKEFTDPYALGGGSFTGPSYDSDLGESWQGTMDDLVSQVLQEVDGYPHHFWLHFIHAAEILGYKHPNQAINEWWLKTYSILAQDMHLRLETEEQLDSRLGDSREGWLAWNHPATTR